MLQKGARVRCVSVNWFGAKCSSVRSQLRSVTKHSRRNKVCDPERKLAAKTKMARGLKEFLSNGQVCNCCLCQLVLARKTSTAETADRLCELNVRCIRTYSTMSFSPI